MGYGMEWSIQKLSHLSDNHSSSMVIYRISPWVDKRDKLDNLCVFFSKFTLPKFFFWMSFFWSSSDNSSYDLRSVSILKKVDKVNRRKTGKKIIDSSTRSIPVHNHPLFSEPFLTDFGFPAMSSIMDALLLTLGRSLEKGNISRVDKANSPYIYETFCQASKQKILETWVPQWHLLCKNSWSLTNLFKSYFSSKHINIHQQERTPVCHGIPTYPLFLNPPCSSATSLFAPLRRLVQCLPTVVHNAVATSDIGHASWRSTWWCLPWKIHDLNHQSCFPVVFLAWNKPVRDMHLLPKMKIDLYNI